MDQQLLLKDLAEILEIPSVLGDAAPSAPFGIQNRRALDWFLAKAKSYGLTVKDCEGYCGYAELGDGKGLVGVLAHIDVVPAGNGWSSPAYGLHIEDGSLYGRGVVDNKGPLVIALHILKDLAESKTPLQKRVRLIVGCNEENGSACMKHYVKGQEIPDVSFVPDSDFPIIGSEKGILHLEVEFDRDDYLAENICPFAVGSRPNVVPDNAQIVVKYNSPLFHNIYSLCGGDFGSVPTLPMAARHIIDSGYRLEDYYLTCDENLVLGANGVAGHAMEPQKGENAISKAVSLLHFLCGGQSPTLQKICHYLAPKDALQKCQIDCRDEQSGQLTMNMGLLSMQGGVVKCTLDLRLPLCADKEKIIQALKSRLNAKVSVLHYAKNLFVDPKDKTLNLLLDVYHKNTGLEKHIIRSGGGTYARELPHAVAFGPTFESTPTYIHNADETMSVENFMLLYKIYYDAVLALCNQK